MGIFPKKYLEVPVVSSSKIRKGSSLDRDHFASHHAKERIERCFRILLVLINVPNSLEGPPSRSKVSHGHFWLYTGRYAPTLIFNASKWSSIHFPYAEDVLAAQNARHGCARQAGDQDCLEDEWALTWSAYETWIGKAPLMLIWQLSRQTSLQKYCCCFGSFFKIASTLEPFKMSSHGVLQRQQFRCSPCITNHAASLLPRRLSSLSETSLIRQQSFSRTQCRNMKLSSTRAAAQQILGPGASLFASAHWRTCIS